MYHSITFRDSSGRDLNTYDDFKLVPKTRPLLAPPTLKEEKVNIPGRGDGPLDYTGILNGFRFDSRSGSWEFYVLNAEAVNGYAQGGITNENAWLQKYSNILSKLHGKEFKVILEDDPTHYYNAYIEVGTWQTGKDYSTITISYRANPRRKSL